MTDPAWRIQIEELLKIPLLGKDIQELADGIEALLLTIQEQTDRNSRVDELKRLPWNHQIHAFSWHDIQDRIEDLTRKEAK